MKKADKLALKEKTLPQLQQLLEKTQKELVQARLALHANKLEDTSKVYRLRKEVARIKTILTIKNRNLEQDQNLDQNNQE